MCRFTLYLGPSISLSALLTDPEHSLIRQSAHSQEREEPLNGDGFGVGWYASEFNHEPAVFRSITPAWNNRNLQNLARVVASGCVLAHVRAATQSSGVNEANCHPFRFQQYLFMHNGDVGNFRQVRRPLLAEVSDQAFNNVYGSTDSEHFFAVLIDEMLKLAADTPPLARMAAAMEATIAHVLEIVARYGAGEPCHLNCAIADGEHAVVSRFANDSDEAPPTLYYFAGSLYPTAGSSLAEVSSSAAPIIVSSERLTPDPGWEVIPPNHLICLSRSAPPELKSLSHLAAMRPELRSLSPIPASPIQAAPIAVG
jgi:ergothioneine biosynthesis protein EgtC